MTGAPGNRGQRPSQRLLSDPFIRWRSHVQDGKLRLRAHKVRGLDLMMQQLVWARHRDNADDCQTPVMSGCGRARSLRPGELAQASVMGALCAAIAIVAVVLPHA